MSRTFEIKDCNNHLPQIFLGKSDSISCDKQLTNSSPEWLNLHRNSSTVHCWHRIYMNLSCICSATVFIAPGQQSLVPSSLLFAKFTYCKIVAYCNRPLINRIDEATCYIFQNDGARTYTQTSFIDIHPDLLYCHCLRSTNMLLSLVCSIFQSNHMCPPWKIFSAYSKDVILQEVI
jgi:hypothetical protein